MRRDGCLDMAGNVWEWTCSEYVPDYDGAEQRCAGDNRADKNALFSFRGSTWEGNAATVRAATRLGRTSTYREDEVGFRLARSL